MLLPSPFVWVICFMKWKKLNKETSILLQLEVGAELSFDLNNAGSYKVTDFCPEWYMKMSCCEVNSVLVLIFFYHVTTDLGSRNSTVMRLYVFHCFVLSPILDWLSLFRSSLLLLFKIIAIIMDATNTSCLLLCLYLYEIELIIKTLGKLIL